MHIVIGLLVALICVAMLSNRKTRGCRWRRNKARDCEGQVYWSCHACGAEYWTANEKLPKLCQKGLDHDQDAV